MCVQELVNPFVMFGFRYSFLELAWAVQGTSGEVHA
jgi:hypothetical protein